MAKFEASGWGPLSIGMTADEAKAALAGAKIPFEETRLHKTGDLLLKFTREVDGWKCTVYFDAVAGTLVNQIGFQSAEMSEAKAKAWISAMEIKHGPATQEVKGKGWNGGMRTWEGPKADLKVQHSVQKATLTEDAKWVLFETYGRPERTDGSASVPAPQPAKAPVKKAGKSFEATGWGPLDFTMDQDAVRDALTMSGLAFEEKTGDLFTMKAPLGGDVELSFRPAVRPLPNAPANVKPKGKGTGSEKKILSLVSMHRTGLKEAEAMKRLATLSEDYGPPDETRATSTNLPTAQYAWNNRTTQLALTIAKSKDGTWSVQESYRDKLYEAR